MRRREFITLVGSAAAAWPLAARAQRAMPVIGFLSTLSPESNAPRLAAFGRALSEFGLVDGRNVAIEYRFVQGQYDRLSEMANELSRRQVAVIVAAGGEPSALAAKSATSTIPIVFVMGSDPVKAGLVASYNRPGGNLTGINILTDTLEAKRLGLLHELVPQAGTVGFLWNPRFASADSQLRDVQEAARIVSMTIRVLPASNDREIELAFEIVAQEQIRALAVAADPFLTMSGGKIVALAAFSRARDVRVSWPSGGWWPDELRGRRRRGVPPGRCLRWPHPRGRSASGPAGIAADQVRVRHQCEDRQGNRS